MLFASGAKNGEQQSTMQLQIMNNTREIWTHYSSDLKLHTPPVGLEPTISPSTYSYKVSLNALLNASHATQHN